MNSEVFHRRDRNDFLIFAVHKVITFPSLFFSTDKGKQKKITYTAWNISEH